MARLSNLGRMVGLFGLSFFLIGFVNPTTALLMYIVSIFCLAIIFGAYAFARLALRGIRCERILPGSTIFSGDPLNSRIQLHEKKHGWRLLAIHDEYVNLITGQKTRRKMTLMTEGTAMNTAMVAGSRQPITLLDDGGRVTEVQDVMRFAHRGHYRLGPLVVNAHDPLGLLSVTRVFPDDHEIIVYPHPLPISHLMMSGFGGRQTAEVRTAGRVGESAMFHGIRPYAQGDDLRRVHWKSTAHTGKLAIKEFEFSYSGAVQVILDLQSGIYFGEGDYSSLETAISFVASIINHVISTGNQAGLLATREKIVRYSQESGQRQLHRVLEMLALAKDDGEISLAKALASSEAPASHRSTTIVITPSTDTAILGPLLALRGRSAKLALVLLDARSFAEAEAESKKAPHPLLALATTQVSLTKGIMLPKSSWPRAGAFSELLGGALASGIEVYPVTASMPLHQAVQGIGAHLQ